MADESPVVHARCNRCGKSVSGFPGDYGKCTSCKHLTRLPAEPPSGWRLVHQADKLNVLPFYFVALFYASVVAIFWTGGGTDLIGASIVVIVFAMWIYSLMTFSRAAERQKGRWIVTIEYHVASLLALVSFFVLLPGCMDVFQGHIATLFSLRTLGAFTALPICVLLYGDARRRLAHLRIVRA